MESRDAGEPLTRHFGLLQATALNVTTVVGAGVFITIPLMLREIPGPYSVLGWLVAGVLIFFDGMIWSELGATLPGSGGSYLFLLECYGREKWGRLLAFLFIWQFLLSGPLEVSTALIAIAQFSLALNDDFKSYSEASTHRWVLLEDADLAVSFGPSRVLGIAIGLGLLFLLYRRISVLGKLTVTFWVGVVGAIGIILVTGLVHFDPAVAFDFSGAGARLPDQFAGHLGAAMILALYSYLGYYNVCYIGDEVRDPGRTIPRAILLSAVLVTVLFVGLHLAMLGTISWRDVPTEKPAVDSYNLAATFMERIYGPWAGTLVALLLIWSSIGSAFALLLGYSRVPYGAAHYGHFFSVFGRVHPVHAIPHISLLFVGALMLFWSVFDLQNVINALITTRILEQFIGQIVGVMILRRTQPDRPRPFRIWLYPVPCGIAFFGWTFVYLTSGWVYVGLGLATLCVGALVFFAWARLTRKWPFERPEPIRTATP